jgi:N-dimethylarginine dimethylaminohydrolase
LKEIIVGTAEFATIPDPNISTLKCHFPEYEERYIKEKYGLYPKQVIEEQTEDLQALSDCLESLGVIVHRPITQWATHEFQSPTWRGKNWHYYSPRDIHLIVGNTIIETPSPLWNRQFESWGYRDILMSLWKRGFKWIKAPIPLLQDHNYKEDVNGVPALNDHEILFEAANCVRVNNDIIYQVSNTGNWLGGKWLQSVLPDFKIHSYDSIYSYAHLDSTILPLREGLVMYNASRVTPENEPEVFASWDKVWIEECVSLGNNFGLPWGASEWIGMNMLSVSPNLAIVDKKQIEIHKKLNARGIDTIPLELRHDRLLAGGFHCVTLDLVRDND